MKLYDFDAEHGWCAVKGEPFNVGQLENMLYQEFLLTVSTCKVKEAGFFAEVISRAPGNIELFRIGALKRIEYEGFGVNLQNDIDNPMFYLFYLDKVDFPDFEAPVLYGSAWTYEPISDILDAKANELKLVLRMKDIPHIKERGALKGYRRS